MTDNFSEGDVRGATSTRSLNNPQNGQATNVCPYILDLVRQQNVKTHHNTSIDQIPVEVLCLIFIFVKEAYDDDFGEPWHQLRTQSPHLTVGTVCKSWRDITTQTPQLWTDIMVNLQTPAAVQLNMVNKWARRSGVLPLNLTISLGDSYLALEHKILDECEEMVKTLRSRVFRWNDLALHAPWTYCHRLLHDLQDLPSIQSFYYVPMMYELGVPYPIRLQHPLRPKRFYSLFSVGLPIPFVWDDLVHLDINGIAKGELLHILRHAQNLRHCVTQMVYDAVDEQHPIPITHITSPSLIHLQTNSQILAHSTLPSLRSLEYVTLKMFGNPGHVDPLVGLMNRSCPPLEKFTIRCDYWPGELNSFFEKLAGITQLSIAVHRAPDDYSSIDQFLQILTDTSSKIVLPNLEKFIFDFPFLLPSSWSLFSRLFRRDMHVDSQGMEETKSPLLATFGRPLSTLHIYVSGDGLEEENDKGAFLHLLEVRKSGMDLCLHDSDSLEESLWSRIARFCDVSF